MLVGVTALKCGSTDIFTAFFGGKGGKVRTSTVLIGSPQFCRDWKEIEIMNFKKALVGSDTEMEDTNLGVGAERVDQVSIENVEKSTKSNEFLERDLLAGGSSHVSGLAAKKSTKVFSSTQETLDEPLKGGVLNSSEVVPDNAIIKQKQNKKGKKELLISESTTPFKGNVSLSSKRVINKKVDGVEDHSGGGASLDSKAGQRGAKRRALGQGSEDEDIASMASGREETVVAGGTKSLPAASGRALMAAGTYPQLIHVDCEDDVSTGLERERGRKERSSDRTPPAITTLLPPLHLMGTPEQEEALAEFPHFTPEMRMTIWRQLAAPKRIAALLGGDSGGPHTVEGLYKAALARELGRLKAHGRRDRELPDGAQDPGGLEAGLVGTALLLPGNGAPQMSSPPVKLRKGPEGAAIKSELAGSDVEDAQTGWVDVPPLLGEDHSFHMSFSDVHFVAPLVMQPALVDILEETTEDGQVAGMEDAELHFHLPVRRAGLRASDGGSWATDSEDEVSSLGEAGAWPSGGLSELEYATHLAGLQVTYPVDWREDGETSEDMRWFNPFYHTMEPDGWSHRGISKGRREDIRAYALTRGLEWALVNHKDGDTPLRRINGYDKTLLDAELFAMNRVVQDAANGLGPQRIYGMEENLPQDLCEELWLMAVYAAHLNSQTDVNAPNPRAATEEFYGKLVVQFLVEVSNPQAEAYAELCETSSDLVGLQALMFPPHPPPLPLDRRDFIWKQAFGAEKQEETRLASAEKDVYLSTFRSYVALCRKEVEAGVPLAEDDVVRFYSDPTFMGQLRRQTVALQRTKGGLGTPFAQGGMAGGTDPVPSADFWNSFGARAWDTRTLRSSEPYYKRLVERVERLMEDVSERTTERVAQRLADIECTPEYIARYKQCVFNALWEEELNHSLTALEWKLLFGPDLSSPEAEVAPSLLIEAAAVEHLPLPYSLLGPAELELKLAGYPHLDRTQREALWNKAERRSETLNAADSMEGDRSEVKDEYIFLLERTMRSADKVHRVATGDQVSCGKRTESSTSAPQTEFIRIMQNRDTLDRSPVRVMKGDSPPLPDSAHRILHDVHAARVVGKSGYSRTASRRNSPSRLEGGRDGPPQQAEPCLTRLDAQAIPMEGHEGAMSSSELAEREPGLCDSLHPANPEVALVGRVLPTDLLGIGGTALALGGEAMIEQALLRQGYQSATEACERAGWTVKARRLLIDLALPILQREWLLSLEATDEQRQRDKTRWRPEELLENIEQRNQVQQFAVWLREEETRLYGYFCSLAAWEEAYPLETSAFCNGVFNQEVAGELRDRDFTIEDARRMKCAMDQGVRERAAVVQTQLRDQQLDRVAAIAARPDYLTGDVQGLVVAALTGPLIQEMVTKSATNLEGHSTQHEAQCATGFPGESAVRGTSSGSAARLRDGREPSSELHRGAGAAEVQDGGPTDADPGARNLSHSLSQVSMMDSDSVGDPPGDNRDHILPLAMEKSGGPAVGVLQAQPRSKFWVRHPGDGYYAALEEEDSEDDNLKARDVLDEQETTARAPAFTTKSRGKQRQRLIKQEAKEAEIAKASAVLPHTRRMGSAGRTKSAEAAVTLLRAMAEQAALTTAMATREARRNLPLFSTTLAEFCTRPDVINRVPAALDELLEALGYDYVESPAGLGVPVMRRFLAEIWGYLSLGGKQHGIWALGDMTVAQPDISQQLLEMRATAYSADTYALNPVEAICVIGSFLSTMYNETSHGQRDGSLWTGGVDLTEIRAFLHLEAPPRAWPTGPVDCTGLDAPGVPGPDDRLLLAAEPWATRMVRRLTVEQVRYIPQTYQDATLHMLGYPMDSTPEMFELDQPLLLEIARDLAARHSMLCRPALDTLPSWSAEDLATDPSPGFVMSEESRARMVALKEEESDEEDDDGEEEEEEVVSAVVPSQPSPLFTPSQASMQMASQDSDRSALAPLHLSMGTSMSTAADHIPMDVVDTESGGVASTHLDYSTGRTGMASTASVGKEDPEWFMAAIGECSGGEAAGSGSLNAPASRAELAFGQYCWANGLEHCMAQGIPDNQLILNLRRYGLPQHWIGQAEFFLDGAPIKPVEIELFRRTYLAWKGLPAGLRSEAPRREGPEVLGAPLQQNCRRVSFSGLSSAGPLKQYNTDTGGGFGTMDDDPYVQDQHEETFEAGDYTLDHVTPILTAAFMDVPAGGALGTALRASPTNSMEPEEQVLVACMVEDIQQIESTSEEQMAECVSACITRLRYDVALVATAGSRKTTDGSRNCCGYLALMRSSRSTS